MIVSHQKSMLTDKNKYNPIFIGFLILWTCVNFIQAATTTLANDEAYYWMFSNNLDWGYFDHPPMLAFFIKIGYFLFPNELGVRFFIVLLSTGTICIIYQLTNSSPSKWLFPVTYASIVMLNAFGFIAWTDIPLYFFTALYFLLYKKYLREDNWKNAVLLGICIALLLYSKYHGVLVLFFTILSNWKLLTRKTFYIIAATAIILYLPHIWWQISHDYPSVKYHLIYRSVKPYKFEYTWNYALSQLLVAGPLTGIILFIAVIKNKWKDDFEKALFFTLWGFVIFFFISSFKGRTEANWTIPAFVPLVVIGFNYINGKSNWEKWIFRLGLPSIFLFCIARIFIASDSLPSFVKVKTQFHNWEKWAAEIKSIAGENPVVFFNSYQMAAKYQFYSGIEAHSYNNYQYRKNQYDLWNYEEKFANRKVLVLPNQPYLPDLRVLKTSNGYTHNYVFDNDFRTLGKIEIKAEKKERQVNPGEIIDLPITLVNNYDHRVESAGFKDSVNLKVILYEKGQTKEFLLNSPLQELNLNPGESVDHTIRFKAPTNPGIYYIRLCISYGWLPAALNSEMYKIEIK